jgi:hypothetical protein
MAAKKTAVTQAKHTLPANWEEELEKEAAQYAKQEESVVTGAFFGTKSGVLTWQDEPLKNNTLIGVILDSVLENVYYEGEWDPDNPAGPKCFAFGRDEAEMIPHEIVFKAGNQMCGASKLCNGCEMNEWGSANKGAGKACKNSRRLAIIPAGVLDANGKVKVTEDVEHYESATVGFMRLPVTSVKGYAGYVKQLSAALKRPPHGVITKIYLVPDAKSQFKVMFEAQGNVPKELMGAIMARHKEIKELIMFPYTQFEEDEKPKSRAAKQPARGKRKY